jgi:hypothetical protein
MTCLAVTLWMLLDQNLVASEWMIGGLEAKVLSHVCLVFALDMFLQERNQWGALLLGLCFSFHPAVGMWAGLGVGGTLLLLRTPVKQLLVMAGLVILGALPGLVGMVMLLSHSGTNSLEVWKFIVLVQAPQHFDPWSWVKRDMFLLYAMFVFNGLHAWSCRDNRVLRFLFYFQIFLCCFFTMGLFWRWAEWFLLLRYFPFRLFPVWTFLLFLLQLMYLYHHQRHQNPGRLLVFTGFVCIMSLGNPFGHLSDKIIKTRRLWQAQDQDLRQSLLWLSRNTPKDSIAIMPPWFGDSIYLSQRGQIANWWANRYDKLPEWKARLEAMLGQIPPATTDPKVALIKRRYHQLTPAQIQTIVRKYGGQYLVSKTPYDYPILFRTSTYRVYALHK